VTAYTDTEKRHAMRLYAALAPTWYERAARWLMLRAWRVNEESGPFAWIGNTLDTLETRSRLYRADRTPYGTNPPAWRRRMRAESRRDERRGDS
jgi:hypothetical protein